jgi:hypothetical protein
MSESLQCTLEDVACVSQHRPRLLPPHPWAMTRDSWVLPRHTPRAQSELGRWISPWKNSWNPFPFPSQLIISISCKDTRSRLGCLGWICTLTTVSSPGTGANLHQKSLKNYIVFHWSLKFSSNLITPQEKEFVRFREVPSVLSGFSARFSTVLTIFHYLVATNAKSFLGWSPWSSITKMKKKTEKGGWP